MDHSSRSSDSSIAISQRLEEPLAKSAKPPVGLVFSSFINAPVTSTHYIMEVRSRSDPPSDVFEDARRALPNNEGDFDGYRHEPQCNDTVEWSRRGSNPLPPSCKPGALPDEL